MAEQVDLEQAASAIDLQKRLSSHIKQKMSDPEWVKRYIERDGEAHSIRVEMGKLDNKKREAKKRGDTETVEKLEEQHTELVNKLRELERSG